MCNLYSLNKKRDAVARYFRVSSNRAEAFEPAPAIFPGYVASVVRKADDGERELVLMNWGFVLLQQGKAPRRVTNVRDDKILDSRFWRPSFEARRCLVPASSYCEPVGQKPATYHWHALSSDEQRPLFAFPGIWRDYFGPTKKDGENVTQRVFAFMTCGPNTLETAQYHERMPVLLEGEEQFEAWLQGTVKEALALARPYPAERMEIVQSGYDKEDLLQVEKRAPGLGEDLAP